MDKEFNVLELISKGSITNELDYERCLIADRNLRKLAKNDPIYKELRSKLRDLIEVYENNNWSADIEISDEKLEESNQAEIIAEKERLFKVKRKELIRKELKLRGLKQNHLIELLNHRKSYISEILNGVKPMSLKDARIIGKTLNIDLEYLIPNFLSVREIEKISEFYENHSLTNNILVKHTNLSLQIILREPYKFLLGDLFKEDCGKFMPANNKNVNFNLCLSNY